MFDAKQEEIIAKRLERREKHRLEKEMRRQQNKGNAAPHTTAQATPSDDPPAIEADPRDEF